MERPNSDWCEEHHNAILEMGRDIKWIVEDSKKRNHVIEKHINESDDFRTQVTRNTTWRNVFKLVILAITGWISWITKMHWDR